MASRASKNFIYKRMDQPKLHPEAKQAADIRKKVGDNLFPVIADKLLEGKKIRRETAEKMKKLGY